jgi:hypothetical protein
MASHSLRSQLRTHAIHAQEARQCLDEHVLPILTKLTHSSNQDRRDVAQAAYRSASDARDLLDKAEILLETTRQFFGGATAAVPPIKGEAGGPPTREQPATSL